MSFRAVDATLGSDSTCRQDIVAGDHAHDDARLLAVLDGVDDARPEGILDAKDAQERHVAVGLGKIGKLRILLRDGIWRRPDIKVTEGYGYGAQRLRRIARDDLQERVLVGLRKLDRPQIVGRRVGEDACAAVEEDLRGTLCVDAELAVGKTHDRRHVLDGRIEGHDLDDVGIGTLLGDGAGTEMILAELEQCHLGLGADEGVLVLDDAFEGGRVDGVGLDDEVFDLAAE